MPAEAVVMRVGDRRPILSAKLSLKGAPGTNPLSGAIAVTFTLIDKKSGAKKVDAAVANIDSVQGQTVSYDWASGDTDTAGCYRGVFTVDYGGGVLQSFPPCDTDGIDVDIFA